MNATPLLEESQGNLKRGDVLRVSGDKSASRLSEGEIFQRIDVLMKEVSSLMEVLENDKTQQDCKQQTPR